MSFHNSLYNISPDILPLQSVPLKVKLAKGKDNEKSWGEKCMDALESIGKQQFNENLKLVENYEMIKGRFIFNHYFHTEGYQSLLNQLTAEFELPTYLRHYDIISNVVNTLSGEWQKRPDTFKVRQLGELATNEYLRTKIDLTKNYVISKINAEVDKKLLDQGVDVNKEDFASQEEADQYQQQISELKNQLTPKEIQKYMDTSFLTIAEIWGQAKKDEDKERFNLPEKEKTEFEDMLVADRCFRHFYITANGYEQETWNPINVFFHKSPDTVYIEEGDYVGRCFSLSINTIIDRYGFKMSKEDFEMFNGEKDKNSKKWEDQQYSWVYDNYLVPFQGYPAYDMMKNVGGLTNNPTGVPQISGDFFSSANNGNGFKEREGYYFVTEGYWKTQKTIIKITYVEEETQQIAVRIVDENFDIPKYFKESKNIFDEEHEINTYCVTQINEVWRGIKISASGGGRLKKDLYLSIQPNDFQFKGDLNIYGCKLPVCGQVFSVRNSRSMSLVDMMKPYQIAFNVAMNQMYQLMEKEIGVFVVMDVNMFPNSKDWGGEDSWDKWMVMAKHYGILPADTTPQNVKSSLAASGGFLPKVLDLNLASQMVSRQNLAMFFKNMALEQVGFNQYRTGGFSSNATATGVEQGMAKSYSQTDSYFTNFSNYLRRCLNMNLNIAQYVESKKDNIQVTYTKGDFSKAFIKILGTDLLLSELGVIVSNSQEHIRQLEMLRQFALNNNTSGMSPTDVADIIMMNSPAEIRNHLKLSHEKMMQQQSQAQQMQQQAMEQDKELKTTELAKKEEQFYAKLDNDLEIAKIKAGTDIILSEDGNAEPPEDTSFEDSIKRQESESNSNVKKEKLRIEKEKLKMNNDYNQKKLALAQSKINADLQIQNQETQTARIMKNKEVP